jgi:hypothetical protein
MYIFLQKSVDFFCRDLQKVCTSLQKSTDFFLHKNLQLSAESVHLFAERLYILQFLQKSKIYAERVPLSAEICRR